MDLLHSSGVLHVGTKYWGFLSGSVIKNRPAMQEAWVLSLGQEDPLEEGIAIDSSILAWRIPWTEEPGRLEPIGWQRAGHDWSDWAEHTATNVDRNLLWPSPLLNLSPNWRTAPFQNKRFIYEQDRKPYLVNLRFCPISSYCFYKVLNVIHKQNWKTKHTRLSLNSSGPQFAHLENSLLFLYLPPSVGVRKIRKILDIRKERCHHLEREHYQKYLNRCPARSLPY